MTCYYDPETEEIKSHPNFDSQIYAEEEMWKDVLGEIEGNPDKYIPFEPITSTESFRMMEDFIDTIDDLHLRERLISALNKPKPFRNFNNEIDNSGAYRQKWFDFKTKSYIQMIKDQIATINCNPEG